MLQNKPRLAMLTVLLLALVLVVVLSMRAASLGTPAPTVSLESERTAAVATFGSGLTRTAQARPTNTSTATPLPTDTPAGTPLTSPTPTCYKLHYVRDVNVADYTVMIPGLMFTKTWEVENTGTCAWSGANASANANP